MQVIDFEVIKQRFYLKLTQYPFKERLELYQNIRPEFEKLIKIMIELNLYIPLFDENIKEVKKLLEMIDKDCNELSEE